MREKAIQTRTNLSSSVENYAHVIIFSAAMWRKMVELGSCII